MAEEAIGAGLMKGVRVRKISRYALDDFSFSPPSNDDQGGFLHLKFDTKANHKTDINVNQDMIEQIQPVTGGSGIRAAISVGSSGISLVPVRSDTGIDNQEIQIATPPKKDSAEVILPAGFSESVKSAANAKFTSDTLAEVRTALRKKSLVQRVQDLSLERPADIQQQEKQDTLTSLAPFQGQVRRSPEARRRRISLPCPPPSAMASEPHSSDQPQRKISVVHNNFFSRALFSGAIIEQPQNVDATLNPVLPSPAIPDTVLQLPNDTPDLGNVSPSKSASKRKPKASQLREMNFWSPTSM